MGSTRLISVKCGSTSACTPPSALGQALRALRSELLTAIGRPSAPRRRRGRRARHLRGHRGRASLVCLPDPPDPACGTVSPRRVPQRPSLHWASSRLAYYSRARAAPSSAVRRPRDIDVIHFQEYTPWLAPTLDYRAFRRRGLRANLYRSQCRVPLFQSESAPPADPRLVPPVGLAFVRRAAGPHRRAARDARRVPRAGASADLRDPARRLEHPRRGAAPPAPGYAVDVRADSSAGRTEPAALLRSDPAEQRGGRPVEGDGLVSARASAT